MPSARQIRAQHAHDQARSQTARPRWALLHPSRNRCRTPSHTPGGTLRAHARARAPKSLILSCANFRELYPSHTERNDIP